MQRSRSHKVYNVKSKKEMKEFCKKYKKGLLTSVSILSMLIVFSIIAFHNLGKFETSDEDLWKEDRIARYWDGIKNGLANGDWTNTYVNDKPGVTVSILSGWAMNGIPDPSKQASFKKEHGKYLFQIYRTENTETINQALRIPIVLFTMIMCGIMGFLIYRWTDSWGITIFSMLMIALNPVLLGMSQIINPDAILWPSVFVAVLGFLLVLKTRSWWYVLLVGIFFGWAIASKYTGNLLSLFFLILLVLSLFFENERVKKNIRNARTLFIQLIVITGIGYAFFAVLVPFVLVKPHLFLLGTFLSPGIGQIIAPVIIVFVVLFFDVFALRARVSGFIQRRAQSWKNWILRISAIVLLLLFVGHIVNAWTGAKFVPLNDMREMIEFQTGQKGSAKITLVFPMINERDGVIVAFAKKILVESSYIFFTLPSIVVVALIFGMILIIIRGRVCYFGYVAFALTVPWVFVIGGLMANVLVNVRYGIILQPILALLAAIFVWEAIMLIKKEYQFVVALGVGAAILLSQMVALRSIEPYYLDYQNKFLPQHMSFADSWSYGLYEAAQWLNADPNARHMQVWTDRKAFCRFFVGKCIRDTLMDLSLVSPDYFVITRRNVMKGSMFRWKTPELANHPSEYYYSDAVLENPVWELQIGDRPLNYVKIIRADEGSSIPDLPEWLIPSDPKTVHENGPIEEVRQNHETRIGEEFQEED